MKNWFNKEPVCKDGECDVSQIINFPKKKVTHTKNKKQENMTHSKEGNKLAETSPTDT